jgi:alanine dehydrogenase
LQLKLNEGIEMKIGIPKEIKLQEFRVSLTPIYVQELIEAGHEVLIETNAGIGSGFSDQEYAAEGAKIVESHAKVFEQADMIVKVKEPLPEEYKLLKPDQIVFTYLHLAGSETLTRSLMQTKIIGIAYETIEDSGRTPLLAPMSVIAGRMAPMIGGYYLGTHYGGKGILIGGAFGIPHGRVVILGGGVAGLAAAKVASGLGAQVTMLEINDARISYLEDILPKNVSVLKSNKWTLRKLCPEADILIGTVLIPGAPAPRLVTEEMVKSMTPGSVIVDVSIDQGGCAETSHPTSHQDPTYITYGVVHYCVANMPGAYPRTSTLALTNATHPYLRDIADAERNWASLFKKRPAIKKGINLFRGNLTCGPVGDAFGIICDDVSNLLK